MVYYTSYDTREQAKLAVFEYIEVWYNRKRKHSALGYRTPEQYQKYLTENKMSA
ncbi:MAG: putative transposase OrfB [Sphingobacteriales bacterium]|nr:putative transposase OrfB [Sphingobacteriales bacterium]